MRVTHGRRAAVSDAQSEGVVIVDDGRGPLTTAAEPTDRSTGRRRGCAR